MRIGLIGWYGHANAGDERILFALQRFFAGHELLSTRGLDEIYSRAEELNRCDYIFLGGGGLILRGLNRYAEGLMALRPRFSCLGISVEARHWDNANFIAAIKEKSEIILLRDAASQALLDFHYKTVVAPDLTFLYPFPLQASVPDDVCGVNLRRWPYWRGEHNGFFHCLMSQLQRVQPGLEAFYPLKKWSAVQTVAVLRQSFASLTPIPLYLENGCRNDRDALAPYFPEVSCQFSAANFNGIRYMIGMRLHALIFACQMGIPFVSLSYQPKNLAFCQEIGMERFSADLYDGPSLLKAIDLLKSSYAEQRQQLLEASVVCNARICKTMGAVRDLIGAKL